MHVAFMSYNTDDANVVMRSFDVNRMPKRDENKTLPNPMSVCVSHFIRNLRSTRGYTASL